MTLERRIEKLERQDQKTGLGPWIVHSQEEMDRFTEENPGVGGLFMIISRDAWEAL